MGESVCLVRSFSQPSDFSSHETNKVVPHRVLTESVSFGRFASETLSWEKWSAFTQNRYLEEIERFTKPGSVAQKKAFFEAHFKSRAAGRATQTEIEKANVDEIVCEVRKDNLVDLEVPVVVNNDMSMDEVRHEEVSNNEGDSVVPSVKDEITDVRSGEVKVTTDVENLNLMDVPEDKALDEENSTSSSKDRPPSSCGSKACSTSLNLEPSFVIELDDILKNSKKESSSSRNRSIRVLKNRNRLPPEPFHMSISCVPCDITDKTIDRMSLSGAKGAGKANRKNRSGPSSIHMSLNFASSAHQTTQTAPIKLSRNFTSRETMASNAKNSVLRNRNEPTGASKSRKRPFPRTSKESSKAVHCSASASAVTLPGLHPQYNQPSEHKRKVMTVGSSVSCKTSNNGPRQPSVCRENLSTQSKVKAKSVTVSSPFVFRSDERAERRKEFFKKVEEKKKKEDSGKDNFSCGFKVNQNTHLASEEYNNPQVGGLKVPLRCLNSPRFRRIQNPGTENIKRSLQNPNKVSSMKIINTRKSVIEKLKSPKIHHSSTRLQTKIKSQENSSPNIVQN